MPKGTTWRSHKTAKDRTLSRFQFSKEVQIKLASLILNEAGFNWCKERLYLYLMNRCIRGPYVQWCERRTSSVNSGEAVYSIGCRFYSRVNIITRLFSFIANFFLCRSNDICGCLSVSNRIDDFCSPE